MPKNRRGLVLPCLLCAIAASWLAPRTAWPGEPLKLMMSMTIDQQAVEGMPLDWSDDRVLLLARDGRLWDFAASEAHDFRQTSNRFRGYSAAEMRATLRAEFGDRLEVGSSGHYLVACPKGATSRWAEAFERYYRAFVRDFSVRGFKTSEPAYPLVAIVFGSQQDFARYALRDGASASPGVLGYYSVRTNRVALFDTGGDPAANADLATVIHEATHQTAFNTGVHSRFALPPRWVTEGLGTLYEAPGVWDARNHSKLSDRVNATRLRDFRTLLGRGRGPRMLADLIENDRLFETDPLAAYAQSWAMTSYLWETQPQKYAKYLAKTAGAARFQAVGSAQRLADFKAAFGENLLLFDAQCLRHVAGLFSE